MGNIHFETMSMVGFGVVGVLMILLLLAAYQLVYKPMPEVVSA